MDGLGHDRRSRSRRCAQRDRDERSVFASGLVFFGPRARLARDLFRGLESHPAFRAVPRAIALDIRVHRTGVFRHARTRGNFEASNSPRENYATL